MLRRVFATVLRWAYRRSRREAVEQMKKLMAIVCGAALLIAMFSATIASGPEPPDFFEDWEIKKILTPQSYVWLIVANPGSAGTIRAVALAVRPTDMGLIGYKYFENGRPRSFSYSVEKEKIVETELTEEQIKRCLECHKYGRYVREVPPGDVGREVGAQGSAR